MTETASGGQHYYTFGFTRRDGDEKEEERRTVTAANEHEAVVEVVALFIEHGGKDPRKVAAQYINSQLETEAGEGWTPEDFYNSDIQVWFGSTMYYDFELVDSSEDDPSETLAAYIDRMRDEGNVEELHRCLLHAVNSLSAGEGQAIFEDEIEAQRAHERGGQADV